MKRHVILEDQERPLCSVRGCDRPVRPHRLPQSDYCSGHYHRVRKGLGPLAHVPLRPEIDPERFWMNVDRSGGPKSCWPWLGKRNRHGYGLTKFAQLAHRIAWELARDARVPLGLGVLHSCDNPPCCNPAHLRPGTQKDNGIDASLRFRVPFGERNAAARLNDEKVREIRRRLGTGREFHREIAADFGVDRNTVSRIARGEAWRHVA